MRLLYGENAAVAHWVACHIPGLESVVASTPHGEAFGPSTAIGVINEQGLIVGGVVYHNWQPTYRSIELSFAATDPKWLTQDILSALLRYPFVELDCQRITGFTPKKSRRARRFLDRFGFKREGCVEKGFGSDDAIISGLMRTTWERSKWNMTLPERQQERVRRVHDQQAQSSHAA